MKRITWHRQIGSRNSQRILSTTGNDTLRSVDIDDTDLMVRVLLHNSSEQWLEIISLDDEDEGDYWCELNVTQPSYKSPARYLQILGMFIDE